MNRAAGPMILVVDDEQAILRSLKTNLTRHGFDVEVAETAREGLDIYARRHPDLILLDLGLPDMDGMEVIREIRARDATPIVILSVRGAEADKVAALDLGADDYLTKPFGVGELLARLRVAIRHTLRAPTTNSTRFRTGELEVDLGQRLVTVQGAEVHLSPTEYQLLKAFITHPNKVLTDRMLLQQVWGPEYGSEGHYLHVYVGRLRKKLEADPQHPSYIMTEPGVGYRLLAEAS
jgi:two-component system, OmpR family, KDP operon response regulator KdpE